MSVTLEISSDSPGFEPKLLTCEESVISVGCSIGCTIELDHPQINNRHFVIKYEDGKYYITDESSQFGTFLNNEKLDLGATYALGSEQKVKIPGFIIKITTDHEAPKAEKTMVMAKKMLGSMFFDDKDINQNVPFLQNINSKEKFFFSLNKSAFILGKAAHLDFTVNDTELKSEHMSFIRDISGVRLITINNAQVKVNSAEINSSIILKHLDEINIGHSSLVFFAHEDPSFTLKPKNESSGQDFAEKEPKHLAKETKTVGPKPENKNAPKKNNKWLILDSIVAFFALIIFLGLGFFALKML